MRIVGLFLIGVCWRLAWDEATGNEAIGYSPPIVYPYGGTFKFQYALPQNATFFTDYFASFTKRRRRSINSEYQRKIFYELLEQQLSSWCGDGRSCMMKSICEAARLSVRDESLVGEILNVILTPDYGNVPRFREVTYLDAAKAGRNGDDCSVVYSGCPEGCGFLDRISKIHSSTLD